MSFWRRGAWVVPPGEWLWHRWKKIWAWSCLPPWLWHDLVSVLATFLVRHWPEGETCWEVRRDTEASEDVGQQLSAAVTLTPVKRELRQSPGSWFSFSVCLCSCSSYAYLFGCSQHGRLIVVCGLPGCLPNLKLGDCTEKVQFSSSHALPSGFDRSTAIDKLVDNGSLNLSADVGTDPSGCLLHCVPVMKRKEVKVWNWWQVHRYDRTNGSPVNYLWYMLYQAQLTAACLLPAMSFGTGRLRF